MLLNFRLLLLCRPIVTVYQLPKCTLPCWHFPGKNFLKVYFELECEFLFLRYLALIFPFDLMTI